jgi:hypothetical protein
MAFDLKKRNCHQKTRLERLLNYRPRWLGAALIAHNVGRLSKQVQIVEKVKGVEND